MYEKRNMRLMLENLEALNLNNLINISNEMNYIEEKVKKKMSGIRKEKIKKATKKIGDCLIENKEKVFKEINLKTKEEIENVWINLGEQKEKEPENKTVIINTKKNGMLVIVEGREDHFPMDSINIDEWKSIYIDKQIVESHKEDVVLKKIIEIELQKRKSE